MHERRLDPRTSKPYSLSNLLRTRCSREGWLLAVVATADGFVMGSSRTGNDPQAARVAAHASNEVFGRTRQQMFAFASPANPGVHLVGLSFEAAGRQGVIAVLGTGAATSREVLALVACVCRILNEPAKAVAA